MRSLSSSALAKIANNLGNEPITIIEIEWVRNSGNKMAYAERNVDGIPGRILEVTNLDNVINISNSSDSQEITVILDDTDNSIKNIMDNNDVHLRDAWVYQWFEGLDLNDKFLLFKGKINSPVIWNEGDRTVSFTIISQLEDIEIGFSPEEGQFDELSADLIGEPWPMCFGTVLHSRTVRLTDSVKGILGDGIGIADFALKKRYESLVAIATYQFRCTSGFGCELVRDMRFESAVHKQAVQCGIDYDCQERTQRNTFRVFDGEYFPRGTIKLKIGTATLEGHFEGSSNLFKLHKIGSRYKENHPEWINFGDMTDYDSPDFGHIPGRIRSIWTRQCEGGTNHVRCFDNEIVAYNCGGNCDRLNKIIPYPEVAKPWRVVYSALRYIGHIYSPLERHLTGRVIGDNAGYVYLQPGSRVSMATNETQKFVVSIVPGEVIKVTAWAQREGQRYLQDVPPNYYKVYTQDFGAVSAVIVELNDSLSKYENMGWEDDIYVTFKSDVGPNTVDILKYLIQTYTNFTVDNTSFNHVKDKVDKYPSHFAIYDRKNILTVLQEISWQARCAIYLKNDKFYMQYLPEQQTAVTTISKKDIETQTLELFHTDTEDIVTKMICKWQASSIQERPFHTILRHNVAKYGTQEQDYNFYIYNYADAVIKSATFWMIRYSNTWKKVRFETPLTKLNIETLDPVNIDLVGVLANVSVLSTIEKADYDSENHSLIFECWTPVRAGEMTPYIFAYPMDVDQIEQFPTSWEIQQGFDGSSITDNQNAKGTLLKTFKMKKLYPLIMDEPDNEDPYKNKTTDEETDEEIDRRNSDMGGASPSDIGDVKPQWVYPAAQYLGESEPGPESKHLVGEANIPPDGWGNDYPGGPDSALVPGDIDDPTHEDAFDPNDLPDPDDLPENDCYFSVFVWYANPVTMVGTESGWTTENGATGTFVNGALTPLGEQEIFVFDSCTAAEAFAIAMRAYADSPNAVVGESWPYLVSGPWKGVEGLIHATCPDPNCDEPTNPEMVGYRPYVGSQYDAFGVWAGENGVTDGSRF